MELLNNIIYWYLIGGLISFALVFYLITMCNLSPVEFGLTKRRSLIYAFISSWIGVAVFSVAFIIGFGKILFNIGYDDEDKKDE